MTHSRAPRIDQHGEVVYFIDVDARRWRVYDTSVDPSDERAPRVTVHRIGSPSATTRRFVPSDPDAPRRSFTFTPGTRRELTIDDLYRQLLVAVAIRRPDCERRAPRQHRVASRRIAM